MRLQILVPSARTYGSTLAASSETVARSTPSSSAHRSSGAAIGRPRSESCQVPTEPCYRTQVRDRIGNATYRDRMDQHRHAWANTGCSQADGLAGRHVRRRAAGRKPGRLALLGSGRALSSPVVTTFSTSSRPALRAAASGGRPRPATIPACSCVPAGGGESSRFVEPHSSSIQHFVA
jgi:hypothetical protein